MRKAPPWNAIQRALLLAILSFSAVQAQGPTLNFIRDLRVFVDYDDNAATFAQWPVDRFGNRLSQQYIEHAARMAFGLWQSVLPDMSVRFLTSETSANIVLRFGPYTQGISGFGSGGGRAWFPVDWNSNPNFDCGRYAEGKWPNGTPCTISQNIIFLAHTPWGNIEFQNNRLFDEQAHWKHDRNTGNKHFRTSPTSPCVDGSNASAAFFEDCVDYTKFPRYNEDTGSDLIAVIQHEIGHTLMGGHTSDPSNYPFYDANWNYIPNNLVRRRADGTSIMFLGDGSTLCNSRGIFKLDVNRLIHDGYRVNYPYIDGVIVLGKPFGEVYLTSNWEEAVNLMIWPNQSSALTAEQAYNAWYLIDVLPNSQTQARLAAGEAHALAIRPNGSLWAWGDNSHGQIGDGTRNRVLTPKQIHAGPWLSVSGGLDFTVGVRTNGTLWTWGSNASGQLGVPSITADRLTPIQVGTASDWLSVSAGPWQVLALKKDGTAWGWGYNADGELGIGTQASPQTSPVKVCANNSACQDNRYVSIAAGTNHSHALARNGAVWSWGSNTFGQLGTNHFTLRVYPEPLHGGATDWVAVQGGHEHSAALRRDRTLWTWGRNEFGQLGQGFFGGDSPFPIRETTASTLWKQLASGHWHVGAVRTSGGYRSWGYNFSGQLGNNSQVERHTAVSEATNSSLWISAVAKQQHTLALRRDGVLWGWGNNGQGQLGTGTTSSAVISPAATQYRANFISGSLTTYPASPTTTTINLTTTGTMDWIKWARSSLSDVHSKNLFPQRQEYRPVQEIPTYALHNAASSNVQLLGSNTLRFSWSSSDEAGGVSGSNNSTGLTMNKVAGGFQLTVPARAATRTLTVYVGAYRARGRMEAFYSNGSVTSYVNTSLNSSSSATAYTNGVYTLSFSSLDPNSNLVVRWTMSASNATGARVCLQAAALR